MLRRQRSRPVAAGLVLALLCQLIPALPADAQPAGITLTPMTTPAAGQAGLHFINVFGSGFPAGAIAPAAVHVLLEPATAGTAPSAQTVATAVTTLVGSTRRVTFRIPATLVVAAPTFYNVRVSGTTTAGTAFQSTNASVLDVTPPPTLSSVDPSGAFQGAAVTVTIEGQNTTFVQGTTTAVFGAGVRVGGAPAGTFGPVTVVSPTRLQAQVTVDPSATLGGRDVQVRVGTQIASRASAFLVAGPTIVGVEPAALTIPSGGGVGNLLLRLQNPNPAQAMRAALVSSNPAIASMPAEVIIAAGETTGQVLVTGGVAGGPVSITATVNGTSAAADVTVIDRPAPPVVTEPLVDGAITVAGTGVASALVDVYVNGAPAASGAVDANGQFALAVATQLVAGQVVTVTQTVNGITSLPSAPVTVRARTPAPALTSPLIEGGTVVTGMGTPTALVEVFVDGAFVATGTVAVDGTFSATVPPLTAGQQVTATQNVAGQLSVPSAPVTVVAVPPSPTITSPLLEGGTTVSGTGVAGATVETFVDGLSIGTAVVSGTGTWMRLLGTPLAAGEAVTARQTVNGAPSAFTPPVMVQAAPPAPPINAPLVEATTTVTGSGVAGAAVDVFVDGVLEGTTVVGSGGTWVRLLTGPLVAGQRVTARQTVNGIASGLSAEVIVVARPPAPTVIAPLVEGATNVTGTGIAGAALELFVDDLPVGGTTVTGAGTWSLGLATALVTGQRVAARQTVNGIASPLSAAVAVGARPPAPTVDAPIQAGATTVSGRGIPAATVEVLVDGSSAGTTSVIANGTWALPVAIALAAGQAITARQTVGGVVSDLSAPVLVSAVLVQIAIAPAPAATINTGQGLVFTARGTFSDSTVVDPLPGVTWSSSTAVVSIGADGQASGQAAGVAAIRAERDGIQSSPTTVTVKPEPPVVNGPLTAGASAVSGTADNGATVQVFVNGTPRGAAVNADASGVWTVTALAPALADGESVTARQTANGVQSDPSAPVIVTSGAAVLTAINVTPLNLTLPSGGTQQYVATGVFSDASTRDITGDVAWESATPSFAIVTAGGLATALDAGVTTIRATQGSVSGSTTLTVLAPELESIVVAPADQKILTGQVQAFTATGVRTDGTSESLGIVTWSSSNPAAATIDTATGVATGVAQGSTTITATKGAVSGSVTLNVDASVQDPTPPNAIISSPATNATITTVVNVIGTATDANFLKYVLDMAPAGSTTFTPIAAGLAPVTAGVLGQFDPTTLLNDLYTVRLTVFDKGGNATSTSVVYQVTRDVKVGNFTLAFEDVKIGTPGLPLTVTRVYDSRDKRVGDFGFGWRMDVKGLTARANRVQGTAWGVTLSIIFFIPFYNMVALDQHKVSITLPSGKVEEFDMVVAPGSSALLPFFFVDAAYVPRTGTTGSLRAVGNTGLFVNGLQPGAVQLFDDFAGQVFNPTLFEYTAADGTVFTIHTTAGVQRVTDRNGNTLTFGAGGITHSSGPSVAFTRDGQGRITSIRDANNNVHSYTYNGNGDLSSYTDPLGNTTRYLYNLSHGLIEIRDPRGLRPIRNEYDDEGRLVRNIDAFGKVIEYQHNLDTRQEVITDRLGQVTVHEYDSAGNVTRTTDPLGGVTTRTYDARGNQLTEKNPLGDTRTYTYDAQDNRLTDTNALGHRTTYTYNSRRQVLTVRDPLGRVTTNQYDSAGNLIRITDSVGRMTAFTFDGRGLPTSMTDGSNNVTTSQYDNAGRLTRQLDPLGNATTYTYDGNGNRFTESRTRTTDANVETLVTRFQYDAAGRLTQTTFPDGSTTQTIYNALGKTAVTIDPLGRQTTFIYDAAGQLVRTTFPDQSTEESTYDAEGRRLTSTDRAGRVTRFRYDAQGRLVETTYADGSTSSSAYDAIGQITRATDERGNSTRYVYDAAGRRTQIVDASGETMTFGYDNAGNRTSFADANGRNSTFQYDASNRLIRIDHADGSFEETGYDAIGQVVSKRDQAGTVTLFEYDQLGRLIAVTDALNQVTRYTYDEVGNPITQQDASGRLTRFTYDRLGRRNGRTLPLGMSETTAYDAAGNITTRTDFNDYTTTYTYDTLNRLTAKVPDARQGEPVVSFSYTPTGQRSGMVDASGTTTYTYDARERLLQKATPQGTLNYAYDAAGNLISIRSSNTNGTAVDYSYDQLNRLATTVDHRLASAITTYTYDRVGNLTSVAYPNSLTHSYSYNAVNRLTNLNVTASTTTLEGYAYTLGQTGRRTSVSELSGRSVAYTYDALYRLVSETITNASVAGHIGYSYDAVGNRLQRTSTVAPVSTQTFAYDDNDRLTTDSFDANGNTVAANGHTYTYDFENRLKAVDGGAVAILYDGDGNRVAKVVGGMATRYLVDDRNATGHVQVLEEVAGGVAQRVYTYGLDLISQRNQAGAVRFYGYDGHGSVRLLTDSAGDVTDEYDYDAFGTLIRRTGTTANVYLFAGEQFDPDIGVYYLRARYLRTATGRFLTSDSYEGQSADPPSLHKYLYVANDPANGVDPTGHFGIFGLTLTTILLRIAFGAFVGALLSAVDAYLGGRDITQALIAGGAFGAVLGPISAIRILQPLLYGLGLGLSAFGTMQALMEEDYDLAAFRGILLFAGAIASWRYYQFNKNVVEAPPSSLRFSQNSAGGNGRAAALRISMNRYGWAGPPVDAVKTPSGVVVIDNTRTAVALELGMNRIPVRVHQPSDPLPPGMIATGRFGNARTWGEALSFRTGRQNPPLPANGTGVPPSMPR